ncbi:hypothetical protein BDN71DRAFT_1452291 [Pleurotus eryngii]|uniref:Uncharacterized protein n=1 Tax=Pleurotus eryngii TaxID=5323 RepID=A0A9P6DDF3_PLEER|nr:hypothetical protein BDN71DRAFT_1452291 [Pleurotus eryngii]
MESFLAQINRLWTSLKWSPYDVSIEDIEVNQDSTWSPWANISVHSIALFDDLRDPLFMKKNCPKAFRWKPRRPEPMPSCGSDIIIRYAKGGIERTDVVASYSAIKEMAEQAEYDRDGVAHIKIKQKFSFGEATCRFKSSTITSALSMAMRTWGIYPGATSVGGIM